MTHFAGPWILSLYAQSFWASGLAGVFGVEGQGLGWQVAVVGWVLVEAW